MSEPMPGPLVRLARDAMTVLGDGLERIGHPLSGRIRYSTREVDDEAIATALRALETADLRYLRALGHAFTVLVTDEIARREPSADQRGRVTRADGSTREV